LSLSLSLLGAGCFGSDPNQNSQLANGDGSAAGGSTGTLGDASTPITGLALATFDTNLSGFVLNNYPDTAQTNLGSGTWQDAHPTLIPSLSWDSNVGSPGAGSLEVMAPYSGPSQYVDVQAKSFDPQNWSGGKLHVRVMVDAGSTFGGGIQLYVDSTKGLFVFAGTYINVGKGAGWQEFELDISNPMTTGTNGTFDPTQIILYGMQLNTGMAGASATPVTFHIDSFSLEGVTSTTGTGGAGGAAGGAGGTAGGAACGASGSGGAGTGGAGGGGTPGPTQP
jgi:hypothetical protein